jgi:hypothetical protein
MAPREREERKGSEKESEQRTLGKSLLMGEKGRHTITQEVHVGVEKLVVGI